MSWRMEKQAEAEKENEGNMNLNVREFYKFKFGSKSKFNPSPFKLFQEKKEQENKRMCVPSVYIYFAYRNPIWILF